MAEVVRREGVSTLSSKSGSSQGASGSESGDLSQGASRRAGEGDGKINATVERQAREVAAEATRLETKKGRIEGQIDDARDRGDVRAVAKLQSDLDKTRNSLKEAETARDDWPRYLVNAIQRGLKPEQIIEEIKTAQAKRAQVAAQSQTNQPDSIIAELIDSDDDADLKFAQFLRKRVKAGVAVTRDNLDFHRNEYEEFVLKPLADAARAANVVDNSGRDDRKTTTRRTTPPRTAGAGGSDLGGTKTGWKEGTATIDLLRDGFRENDAARARH